MLTNTAINLTIANGAATSDAALLENFFGGVGMVYIPAWTSASLGFQVSSDGVTYTQLRDETGALVQITGIQTATASWYKLPEALHGAKYFKLWSQTSGSDTNQGAERACKLMLKI
jgi:hypothetical protein